jgi:hypothetical protein
VHESIDARARARAQLVDVLSRGRQAAASSHTYHSRPVSWLISLHADSLAWPGIDVHMASYSFLCTNGWVASCELYYVVQCTSFSLHQWVDI